MSRNERSTPALPLDSSLQPGSQAVPEISRTYEESAGSPEFPLPSETPRFLGPRWSLGFIGLLGYIIFEYLRVPAQFPFLRPLALGKVTLGLCALGLAFEIRSKATPALSARVVQFMLAFVVLVGLVSAFLADYQQEGWDGFSDLLKWSLTAFLIGRIATSSWRQRVVVIVMLILNLKMAQAVVRNYSAFRASGADEVVMATKGLGAGSVGFFANSGDLGAAMCVVWGLSAMLLLSESRKSVKVLLLVCLAAFSVAVVASGSRGAFIAVCAQGLVVWLRKPSLKRVGAMLMVFVMLPAFYFILPEANKDRLRSLRDPERDKTARIRLDLWRAGVDMFKDHPVVGVGPGNFNPQYDFRYAGPDRHATVTAPHSIYIQNLAELGLVGLPPLVIIWVGFFLVNRKTRQSLEAHGHKDGKSFEIAMSRGLDLAMIGYLVSGAFATLFYYPHLWILLGLALGLHVAATRPPGGAANSEYAMSHNTLEAEAH